MEATSIEFGKRLLPQIVDHYARTEPDRVYASIPKSNIGLSQGFRDISMAKLASIVNSLAWWLESQLGVGELETIAYIGPADIRYAAMFLAAVKCRYKILFISPRNQVSQNQSMLQRSECKALFYGEELAAATVPLKSNIPDLIVKNVPSLNEILEWDEDTKHYPFNLSFEEVKDEPCLMLHSSGSTGNPKLVTMTHGTFSVTDNDRNMPAPEGRRAQNAAQFNFNGGGKFYSCFPPYHLAGVHAYIDLPIFATSATVVFGPTQLPPSGHLLSEILKYQKVRAFYVPPFIIEQWSAEPVASEQARHLDFILYGGGPLSPSIGNKLSKVTDVCQMYGSLEIGQVQLLVPREGEWSYLELNPFEEADMQAIGDGTFEMVLHQDPKFATRRSLWHNLPDISSWRTGDLFIPHPTKGGLWRFHSRIDDLIVLSTSHKLRPLEMETIIQGDSLLSGALIVGQGKPEPLVIVEPNPGAYDGDSAAFIERIWPSIQASNEIAPKYAQLRRSNILIASPDRPFIRAPKGTIVRKLTVKVYEDDIEAGYAEHHSQIEAEHTMPNSFDSFVLSGVIGYVRTCVEEFLPNVQLSDHDNFFLRGLDSLGAAGLSRKLRVRLVNQAPSANGAVVSLAMIYKYPTIRGLANIIVDAIFDRKVPEVVHDTESIKRAVDDFTKNLPVPSESESSVTVPTPDNGINVVLIGPRGSLGPHLVHNLLLNPRVRKVYCLNRGEKGLQRLQNAIDARDLSREISADDERLVFMPVALGEENLGLSAKNYSELLKNAHVIVHNAWKVDFSWTLDSYRVEHLRSIRSIIDLSAQGIWKPRIVFISSISSVQAWAAIHDTPVPEAPFEGVDSYKVASPLGYGQSKHASERILRKASEESGVKVTILRVGQIAGSTIPGGEPWSTDEWIPSLAMLSKALKLIPNDIPPIDWIPVNLAAQAIGELAIPQDENQQPKTGQLSIFNVVNPHLADWLIFTEVLRERLGKETQLVTLAKWVDSLERTDTRTMSKSEAISSTKILPFFQHLADTAATGAALQPKFETTLGVKSSRAMAEMQAINKSLIDAWCQQWGV